MHLITWDFFPCNGISSHVILAALHIRSYFILNFFQLTLGLIKHGALACCFLVALGLAATTASLQKKRGDPKAAPVSQDKI